MIISCSGSFFFIWFFFCVVWESLKKPNPPQSVHLYTHIQENHYDPSPLQYVISHFFRFFSLLLPFLPSHRRRQSIPILSISLSALFLKYFTARRHSEGWLESEICVSVWLRLMITVGAQSQSERSSWTNLTVGTVATLTHTSHFVHI